MICTTLLVQKKKPVLFSLHLFRLQRQIEFLSIPISVDIQQLILDYIQKFPKPRYALRIKINLQGEISITTRDLPQRLGKIELCLQPQSKQLSWIKYSEREAWNLEKQRIGAQHLLFYSEDELLEFSEGNVFIFHQGKLFTPISDGRILSGTSRAAILFIARSLGHPIIEQKCPLIWLDEGAILFFSSSLRGIRAINGEEVEIISKIQEQFWNLKWMENKELDILKYFQDSFLDIH